MNEVIDEIAKLVLVDGIKDALVSLGKKVISGFYKPNEREKIINAITSIQIATIESRNFINDYGYKRNPDLTNLWHDALKKVVAAKIEDNLPEYLYHKAKFWGEPKDWINNPTTLELVPKLNYLDEKCEMLLKTIKSK